MVVHCLFEQSGTFKNEFKKLGIDAYDYDLLNDFNQTDYIVDLFEQIRLGYDNKPSIFDNVKADDLVFAFFPCTRFSTQIVLNIKGEAYQMRVWTDEQKLEYSRKLFQEMAEYYNLLCMLCIVCLRRNIKMIVENPVNQPSILPFLFCLKPNIVDNDRSKEGDYYRKPTQYFFINCEPKSNFVFGFAKDNRSDVSVMNTHNTVQRSMIHTEYANRFIRRYIL